VRASRALGSPDFSAETAFGASHVLSFDAGRADLRAIARNQLFYKRRFSEFSPSPNVSPDCSILFVNIQ